ncbi:Gmad2 immunoglobulin-like domain-containing protein [Neobacillus sp. NRS-1170]|uniref:Gmad2 immunoglobulin-like domain-containing protein n=1 Tax=Neobacillus sp. NRS-1170 TaxID=3233898 RepID=UPI003D2AED73
MKKIAYLFAILTSIIGLAACNQHQDEKPNHNDPKSHAPEDKVYANKAFKDVVVAESGDKIIVTGKAQVFEGVFHYALYDGEKVLLENKYQTDGAPAWGEFEITFAKKLVTTNDIELELFVFSAKDGSKVDTLEIPIPK